MLKVSGLAEKLRRFQRPNGEPYIIYGDLAYGLTRNILAPFRGVRLTDDQQEFNSRMSKLRVLVEWGFGKICQLFASLDFKKNLKILLQPIGKYYLVADVLANCHTCFYESQKSAFFGLDPPELEEYLSKTQCKNKHKVFKENITSLYSNTTRTDRENKIFCYIIMF